MEGDYDEQSRLLAIVQSWLLRPEPEFRGFRCAVCQNSMNDGAWHRVLRSEAYCTPVHLCDACEEDFKAGAIFSGDSRLFARDDFNPRFSPHAEILLDRIVDGWNEGQGPVRKAFACDLCGGVLPGAEGYHVWRNRSGILMEYHFDPYCMARISSGGNA